MTLFDSTRIKTDPAASRSAVIDVVLGAYGDRPYGAVHDALLQLDPEADPAAIAQTLADLLVDACEWLADLLTAGDGGPAADPAAWLRTLTAIHNLEGGNDG